MLKLKFILTLVTLFLTLTSCFKYEDVQILKVTNIRVNNLSAKKIEIGVDLQIVNPNKYKINIVDSELELFLKGKKIGTAHIIDKIELPKNSDQIHKIAIATDLKDMLSEAIPVILGVLFDESIELQVKGNIKASAKALTKIFPIDFTERVRLNK
jgi:LEA14-like dessication related protein